MLSGVSDWAFRHVFSVDDFIHKAARAGYDGIEFNVYAEGSFITNSTPETMLRRWAGIAVDAGIRLPSISTPLLGTHALNADDQSIRQTGIDIVYSMLDVANVLGAKVLQVVPGCADETTAYGVSYGRSQEIIFQLGDRAKQHGLTLGIENIPGFLGTPLEFARFITEIDHPNVKAYLDIGNATCCGYPQHWIQMLKDQIVGVHIKDVAIRRGTDPLVVPLLSGDVKWQVVLSELRAIQYDGYLIATPSPFMQFHERQLEGIKMDLSAIVGT